MIAPRLYDCAVLLLLLVGKITAPAEELPTPTPNSCMTELHSLSDRLPRFSAEWKVVRFDAADTEVVKAMAQQFDEQIQAATTDAERQQLKHAKSLKVAKASQGEMSSFTLKLDYYHDDRFYMALNVVNPSTSLSDAEYYLNGDGLVYRVSGHSVRVMPLAKAMREFLRGLQSTLPEMVVNRELGGIREWKTLGESRISFQIGGVNGLRGVRLTVEQGTHRLLAYEIGDVDPKLGEGVNFAERDRQIVFKSFRQDLGYPVPKETVVRFYYGRHEPGREDLWTPTRFQVQPDFSQMHSPQHEFKPGYKVTDETGDKPREYSSEEVIGKK